MKKWGNPWGIVLIVLLLIVLGAYIEIVRQNGNAAGASVRLLKTPLFLGGVIIAGLFLPLSLLLYSFFVTHVITLRILVGIASVLLLAEGLFLRYTAVRSGVHIAVC